MLDALDSCLCFFLTAAMAARRDGGRPSKIRGEENMLRCSSRPAGISAKPTWRHGHYAPQFSQTYVPSYPRNSCLTVETLRGYSPGGPNPSPFRGSHQLVGLLSDFSFLISCQLKKLLLYQDTASITEGFCPRT